MNKALSAVLALTLATAAPAAVGEKVYRVVDPETGKVIFTDTPPADESESEQVKLPKPNTQQSVRVPEALLSDDEEQQSDGAVDYASVEIARPRPETTIPPGQLDLVVQVQTDPPLRDQDLIRVLWDGEAVADPASTTSVVVTDMVRGTHRLQAQVLDGDGNVLAASDTIEIYVRRHSRLNP